jgi:uncharacterized membrane protein YdbT with pleckstrin-like domain
MTKDLSGEETYVNTHPSWAAWFWPLCLTVGFWLPIAFLKRRKTRYKVTSERVVKKSGFLATTTNEVRIDSISRLETSQSLSESLFGCGTVIVDTGPDEIRFSAMPKASYVADQIRNAQ